MIHIRVRTAKYVLDGTLDAEGVAKALSVATTSDDEGQARTPATRRADALVDVCRFFVDHQQTRRGGRHRPHLNVVVDVDELATGGSGQVLDGPCVDGTTVSRLLCDSALDRVVTAGRSISSTTGPAPALLCTRHHHRLHRGGWEAKILPDATFTVTDPNGIIRNTSPPRNDPPW